MLPRKRRRRRREQRHPAGIKLDLFARRAVGDGDRFTPTIVTSRYVIALPTSATDGQVGGRRTGQVTRPAKGKACGYLRSRGREPCGDLVKIRSAKGPRTIRRSAVRSADLLPWKGLICKTLTRGRHV